MGAPAAPSRSKRAPVLDDGQATPRLERAGPPSAALVEAPRAAVGGRRVEARAGVAAIARLDEERVVQGGREPFSPPRRAHEEVPEIHGAARPAVGGAGGGR